jgi:hypothetical protein
MNISELQKAQREWQVNTFEHALFHAAKAVGKLAAHVDDMDHAIADGANHRGAAFPPDAEKYIADLVICALKLAKEIPTQDFDLGELVERRMREKGAL